MIATGLVLWTVKRRKHHLASGREVTEPFGVRLVEILNVATIAGLPLAVAAYFWANRLLPIGLADRAAWELHALFAVWLATLFYALGRPLARGWIELLWATSLAFGFLPVLNALTTDRHLGRSLPDGDWVIAGFDLTMLALGALFAVMAVKVRRRLVAPSAAGSGMSAKAVGKGEVAGKTVIAGRAGVVGKVGIVSKAGVAGTAAITGQAGAEPEGEMRKGIA